MLNGFSREASRVHNHENRRHLIGRNCHETASSRCSSVSSVVKKPGWRATAVPVCGGQFHLTVRSAFS